MKKKMRMGVPAGILLFISMIMLASPVPVLAGLEKVTLGAGAGVVPDYEGSDDYAVVPMLSSDVIWESGRYIELSGIGLSGTKLRANIIANDIFRLGPVVNYRFGRDDLISTEDNVVGRMRQLDDSFELGGFTGLQIENWNFMVDFLNDVTSSHEGFVLAFSTGYDLPVTDALTLSFGASTNYVNRDYSRNVFGVDAANAAVSGLPVYDIHSAEFNNVGCNLEALYKLSDKLSMRLTGGYARLFGDAKDSPVVDLRGDEDQYQCGLEAVYTLFSKKEKAVEPPPAPPAPVEAPAPPAPPRDSDGDGVYDDNDKCPDTPQGVKVDSDGCPLDSDGDGVPDYLDECPDTPKGAKVNTKGCWSLAGVVLFDFDRYTIKSSAYPLLDEVVTILKHNPELAVVIEGHTDSKGTNAYNQRLSEKRANAVKKHLESKGIASTRLTSKGYGESQPVASNDTEAGRQENRRVQLQNQK